MGHTSRPTDSAGESEVNPPFSPKPTAILLFSVPQELADAPKFEGHLALLGFVSSSGVTRQRLYRSETCTFDYTVLLTIDHATRWKTWKVRGEVPGDCSFRPRGVTDRLRRHVRTGDEVFDRTFSIFGDIKSALFLLTGLGRQEILLLQDVGEVRLSHQMLIFNAKTTDPDGSVGFLGTATSLFEALRRPLVLHWPARFQGEGDALVRCELIKQALSEAVGVKEAVASLAGKDGDQHVKALAGAFVAGSVAVSPGGSKQEGVVSVSDSKR